MSDITTPKYNIGDLVWAKMKGFSPWPGKIADPTTTKLKRPSGNYRHKNVFCIYFFGSNNFAWIQEDQLKPYFEFKDNYANSCKSAIFKEALVKIETYIKNGNLDELKTLETTGESNEKLDEDKSSPVKLEDKILPSSNNAPQRNYSRTPFNSKNKKTFISSNNDDSAPITKKSRLSTSFDDEETNGVSSTPSTTKLVADTVKSPTKIGARNLLDRTSQYLMDTNTELNFDDGLDIKAVSAKSKSINASTLKFGFIGLGLMGQRLVKNLINSGHIVTIWNRTPNKCKDFIKIGATKAITPADVIFASDITFSCLSGPSAVKEIVFGNCGVLQEIKTDKGYVELTTIDPEVTNDVAEAIISRGGRFLEASIVCNGKQQAEDGNLLLILGGDKTLFNDCRSSFEAISSHTFYLGSSIDVASKMGLVISMLTGNLIGALAEAMALADRIGLSQKDLLEILSLSPLNCPTLLSKGKTMIMSSFPTEMPLTHMQKDLRLTLQMAEEYEHPLPITAATNEVYKSSKSIGYADHDVAAIYVKARF